MAVLALGLGVTMARPMPAAAISNVSLGTGSAVLTFTAESTGLDLIPESHLVGSHLPYCENFAISGTMVVDFSTNTAVYAGPATVTGTYAACGNPTTLQEGVLTFVINGDPLLGDFGCGTAAAPGHGVLLGFGPVLLIALDAICHVGNNVGYLQGELPGVEAITSVSLQTGSPFDSATTGFTDTAVLESNESTFPN